MRKASNKLSVETVETIGYSDMQNRLQNAKKQQIFRHQSYYIKQGILGQSGQYARLQHVKGIHKFPSFRPKNIA